MQPYNPLTAPDPDTWLSLEEFDRVGLVHAYHEDYAVDVPEGNEMLHATIHVMVENQLAQGVTPVRETLARLIDQGLNRHEALHAIGSVLARDLHDCAREGADAATLEKQYYRDLLDLRPEGWC